MLTIAEPYLRYSESLGPTKLQEAGTLLLERLEPLVRAAYVDDGRALPVSLTVRIERGSTKVWVTVTSLVSALVFYGSIRQSIDYMIKDAKNLSALVAREVPNVTPLGDTPSYRERRLGAPGQLRRLFQQVERREISADEATQRAVNLLYEQGGPRALQDSPGVTELISRELHDAVPTRKRRRSPRRPVVPPKQQLILPAEPIPSRRRSGVIVGREGGDGPLRVSTY